MEDGAMEEFDQAAVPHPVTDALLARESTPR